MPVQRVPRYKLLLESLLKATHRSHAEYPAVEQALAKVTDAAAHNNNAMAKNITFDRLMEIQVSLSVTYSQSVGRSVSE